MVDNEPADQTSRHTALQRTSPTNEHSTRSVERRRSVPPRQQRVQCLERPRSIQVGSRRACRNRPSPTALGRSRQLTWELVRAVVASGTTVILTTQYLDEADHLADRIAVIDHGRVIAEGTSAELKASVGSGTLTVSLNDPARPADAQRVLKRALQAPVDRQEGGRLSVRIPVQNGAEELSARGTGALAELETAGIATSQFALGQPSLDEAFLALTGHPAEGQGNFEEKKTWA